MDIRYEKLTKANLDVIKKLQHEIFPESSFEKGYDQVIQKGPKAGGNVLQDYYIAYVDDEPAGTYGLYIQNGVEEHHSIWLGWYGILPSYRGKGLGKQILMDSMEKAREYMEEFPVKYFRLYTSEATNDSAQPLYNRVMTLKEYYRNRELINDYTVEKLREARPGLTDREYRETLQTLIAIFSISLDENEILMPWGDRYMGLMKTVALEQNNL